MGFYCKRSPPFSPPQFPSSVFLYAPPSAPPPLCGCYAGYHTDSNVTALRVTALGHQWLLHRCDSDVYISVTAMATDTAVTAVTTDSAVPAVAADPLCNDVYISVTTMTDDSAMTAVKTDSAVTAAAADSAVTAMCTLV